MATNLSMQRSQGFRRRMKTKIINRRRARGRAILVKIRTNPLKSIR